MAFPTLFTYVSFILEASCAETKFTSPDHGTASVTKVPQILSRLTGRQIVVIVVIGPFAEKAISRIFFRQHVGCSIDSEGICGEEGYQCKNSFHLAGIQGQWMADSEADVAF